MTSKSSDSGLAYLARTTCSRDTRDAILTAYPGAAGDPVLWRALVALLFSVARDEETGRRLIGTSALEWIAGEPIYYSSTRAGAFRTGAEVIDKIRAELLPDLRIVEAVVEFGSKGGNTTANAKRARTIAFDGIDPDVYRAVRDDLATPVADLEHRVRVLDGSVYNDAAVRAAREEDRLEAERRRANAPSETAAYFLDRMNDGEARPRNGYTRLLAHMDRAKVLATQLEVGPKPHETAAEHEARTREARAGYLRLLRAIEDQPQPLYQPSRRGRTDRIFPLNPSVLSLPGPLRRVLTEGAGWRELDLSSAHLAIAASLWGVGSVETFLGSGGDVWAEIAEHLALDDADIRNVGWSRLKEAMKAGTYSAVYGMTAPSIKGAFTKAMKACGVDVRGARFTECWVIRDLLRARDEQFEHITLEGALETPTGIRAALDASTGVDERSVLATAAQAYEAELMRPILAYEQEHIEGSAGHPDFRVMSWTHDGCSVKFWRRRKTHVEEMQRRVRTVAEVYGIPTRLEIR